MKIILILALSTLLIACGKDDQVALDSQSVSLKENLVANCSVIRDEELKHIVISCPDGTEVTIKDGVNGIDGIDGTNGTNGSNGQNGTNGEDGTSCSIEAMPSGSMITCGATSAFIKNGEDGEDGSACSVTTADDNSGSIIKCSDGSVAYINNGLNGEDGEDGEDGNDGLDFVQEVIDPCGTETTHGLDEVIFKLASGDFLAHYAHGKKQYLTILNKNQNYVTTDGTGCKFKINDDNDLVLR